MVLHLLIYEWKRTLKHPTLFLFIFLFPVIFFAVTGFIVYSIVKEEVNSIDLVVIDEDKTFETSTLINQLKSDETLSNQVNFIDGESELNTYLEHPNEYAAIIQIPKGFTEDLRSGVNREINVFLNENIPIGSNLAYLLLSSGEKYISAAQSGVNSVYHYYIKAMDDSSERNRWIQQMTIHFTLLTLSRNDFFSFNEVLDNQWLSWNMQFYISIVTVLFFISYLLWIMFFQQKNDRLITERLSLISVKPYHRFLSQLGHHFTFSIIYIFTITYGIGKIFNISHHGALFIQWLLFALLLHAIYFVIYSIGKSKPFSIGTFFILVTFLILISGLIIPPAYLSDFGLNLTFMHNGFKSILISGDWPYEIWSVIILISVILILFTPLVNRRGSVY